MTEIVNVYVQINERRPIEVIQDVEQLLGIQFDNDTAKVGAQSFIIGGPLLRVIWFSCSREEAMLIRLAYPGTNILRDSRSRSR